MQGAFHTINSDFSHGVAQQALKQAYKEHRYVQMQLVKGKPRSLDQNALIYTLYNKAARRVEGETPQTVRRYCKLTLGVPLLRVEDRAFRETWDNNIKASLTYEQKLAIMDFFPVTSRMNTEQETRYIDAIMVEYDIHEDNGGY